MSKKDKKKKNKKLSREEKWEMFQKYREPVPEDLKDNPYFQLYEAFLKHIVTYEPLELKVVKPMKGLPKGEIYWPEWIDKMPRPWLDEKKEGIPGFEHTPPPPPPDRTPSKPTPPPSQIIEEGEDSKPFRGHPKWKNPC